MSYHGISKLKPVKKDIGNIFVRKAVVFARQGRWGEYEQIIESFSIEQMDALNSILKND